MPEVLVTCVNYHNERETEAFIGKLGEQRIPGTLSTVVVNCNEAGDPDLSFIAGVPGVEVASPGRNLGYFGGAAYGLRRYLEDNPLPDWVVVSNTDIAFPDRDFFGRLLALYPEGAGVVAPSIHSNLSSRDQNPYMARRPPAARMHFYKWIFRFYPVYTAYHALSLARGKLLSVVPGVTSGNAPGDAGAAGGPRSSPRSIYAPHGSFVLFHRRYFEAGGNLDHGAFLFGEEVFVAETARRLGLPVEYDPRLALLHREHATTGLFKNRKVARFQWEASAYCAEEFFSSGR